MSERERDVGGAAGDEPERPSEETLRVPAPDGEDADEVTLVSGSGGEEEPGRRRLGPYELVRSLGRGGQGQVFLAVDERLGRRVAIKLLAPGLALSATSRARFEREAAVASKLDHPGICTVYEVGVAGGAPYIAMQYVEGAPLNEVIARAREPSTDDPPVSHISVGPDDVGDEASGDVSSSSGTHPRRGILAVVEMAERAARALHAAHERGLVHRDIKPGNIILGRGRGPVILDFGLARDEDSDEPALTHSGDVMGTPVYMSPEQITRSSIRLDRRTDVYSLTVTLYECLTLRRPFEAPTREALYQAILTREAPDPRRINRAIPADLAVVLATGLEKDRDRRYQTALDLAEDLRRVRELEPIRAKPAGALLKLGRWAQRNPTVAALTAVTFAILTGALLLTMAKNRALDRAAAELESARRDAVAKATELERLSDAKLLERLVAEADALWPAVPDRVAAMVRWLDEVAPLVARRPAHERQLEALRGEALPYDAAAIRHDYRLELARIEELEEITAEFETALDVTDDAFRRRFLEAELNDIETGIESLRARVGAQRTWRFGSVERQWQHDVLTDLVAALARLEGPETGAIASVRRRLAFAKSVRRRSLDEPGGAWRDVIEAIRRAPPYHGLEITPQLGLVPLGRDPRSSLFEFLHLATHAGPVPQRDARGALPRDEDTGIILILLPGGTVRLGARRGKTPGPHVDPEALSEEAPVHDVTLAPFFLSKHEMTQGQWRRLARSNPSTYQPGQEYANGVITALHPVEHVTWVDADVGTRRLALALPTEAQWEYAARAGTTTPWWTGSDPASIVRAGNVRDRFFHDNGGPTAPGHDPWDDGYVTHAPTGTFEANAFGFHDTIGNVWEWCSDNFGSYAAPVRAGDGERRARNLGSRALRGGSYIDRAVSARVSNRRGYSGLFHYDYLGLRPARPLDRK